MTKRLIELNGKLLKSLYDHYGMNFDYEAGKQYAGESGHDTYGTGYAALIDTLVEYGYAEVITPNLGERRGHKQVNLSFDVRDLISYNSSFDWKRYVYWMAVVPLGVIIPVGAGVVSHFVLSLSLFGLSTQAVAALTSLLSFVYIGLLGLAFLYRDHRRTPKNH